MDIPFSEAVGSDAWLQDARSWVRQRAEQAGLHVNRPIEQPRIRPWSTQLVASTDQGRLWLKANCEALAFEPSLHAVLADLEPGGVDEPLAIEPDRGWMLTRDRGATLGERREPSRADWRRLLATAAAMQRRLAEHGPRLLASGLPDCSPGTVVARFDGMVERLQALPADHPSHLAAGRAAELVDGRAMVAEAVEVLAVPYGWLSQLTEIAFTDVLSAYCEAWTDVLAPAELGALLPAAMTTHAVNRSWTWWGAIAQATTEEAQEWGEAPLHHLALALEPFPPAAG